MEARSVILPENTVWVTDRLGIAIIEGRKIWHGTYTEYRAPGVWTQHHGQLVRMRWECQHEHARLIVGSEVDEDQDWICDACGADDGNPDGWRSATGSIAVVPFVPPDDCEWLTFDHLQALPTETLLWRTTGNPHSPYVTTHLPALDPLPVPGRDFGVVIDYVEVAG